VSKVLVVDDEPEIVQFVTSALQDEGFEVVSAANGRQAVDAAARDRPDLVVLDMMLPRLDGQQVAQGIRRLHGDIPILLVTADGQVRDKAQRVGAFAFLSKPFDVDDLLKLVQRRLAE
jgi:DNA-binding response OmpR family regulator